MQLVIGTNGVEIKVFKNASLLSEYTEGDPTITLCTIKQGWFAFGLASGVVGVYGDRERLWRVKTKLRIVSLLVFPDPESVTCVWNNGKVGKSSSLETDLITTVQNFIVTVAGRHSQGGERRDPR